jgi:hypothetical protein
MRSLISILVLLQFGVFAYAADLQVGAAAVVITPPEGTPLAGYYSIRGSKTVIDDIYAKTIVLEKDGTKVALVVCDLISLPRHSVNDARRLIEKQAGIPGANVMISATHTHTGPVIARESSIDELTGATTDLGKRYTEALPEKIARSVVEANKKLTTAKAAAGIGKEEGISFNRRFVMKDGSVSWNPAKQHPGILRPAGPIDPDVGVIYFEDARARPLATYVNFALHPDTVGGDGVSADYAGVISRLLGDYKGADMLTVFANGCCGNINHRDIAWADRQKGITEARRIGTVLAGNVLKTYTRMKPLADGPLQVKSAIVELDLPPIADADIEKANDVVMRVNNPKTAFLDKVKAFQTLDVAARKGKPLEVEVQIIALGNQAAWVSLPGEIFVELGLDIKKASPFAYTMIAELANGSIGYIPNLSAYAEGNYEVVSARCAKGSGEKLVEAATMLLKELHKPK